MVIVPFLIDQIFVSDKLSGSVAGAVMVLENDIEVRFDSVFLTNHALEPVRYSNVDVEVAKAIALSVIDEGFDYDNVTGKFVASAAKVLA